jgi:hypothetical protein
MRKFLEQLFGEKTAEAKADVPAFLISRQCDGERLDSAHWREVALMSFNETHKPLA